MRPAKSAILIAVLAALVTGGCVASTVNQDDKAKIDAAKALDEAYFAAIRARDWEKAASYHWDDPRSIQILPNVPMPFIGWEEIHTNLPKALTGELGEEVNATVVSDTKLERLRREYIVVGDTVVTWGINRWTYTDADGERVTVLSRALNVKAEIDGKWVYIAGHSSTGGIPKPVEKVLSE